MLPLTPSKITVLTIIFHATATSAITSTLTALFFRLHPPTHPHSHPHTHTGDDSWSPLPYLPSLQKSNFSSQVSVISLKAWLPRSSVVSSALHTVGHWVSKALGRKTSAPPPPPPPSLHHTCSYSGEGAISVRHHVISAILHPQLMQYGRKHLLPQTANFPRRAARREPRKQAIIEPPPRVFTLNKKREAATERLCEFLYLFPPFIKRVFVSIFVTVTTWTSFLCIYWASSCFHFGRKPWGCTERLCELLYLFLPPI